MGTILHTIFPYYSMKDGAYYVNWSLFTNATSGSDSPLEVACQAGELEIVQLLLAARADQHQAANGVSTRPGRGKP